MKSVFAICLLLMAYGMQQAIAEKSPSEVTARDAVDSALKNEAYDSLAKFGEEILPILDTYFGSELNPLGRALILHEIVCRDDGSRMASVTEELEYLLDTLEVEELFGGGERPLLNCLKTDFFDSVGTYFNRFPNLIDRSADPLLVRLYLFERESLSEAQSIFNDKLRGFVAMELARRMLEADETWRRGYDLLEALIDCTNGDVVEFMTRDWGILESRDVMRRCFFLAELTSKGRRYSVEDIVELSFSEGSIVRLLCVDVGDHVFVRYKATEIVQNLIGQSPDDKRLLGFLEKSLRDEDPSVRRMASDIPMWTNPGRGVWGKSEPRTFQGEPAGNFSRLKSHVFEHPDRWKMRVDYSLSHRHFEIGTPEPILGEPLLLRIEMALQDLTGLGESDRYPVRVGEEAFGYGMKLVLYNQRGERFETQIREDGHDELCYYDTGTNLVQFADEDTGVVAYVNLFEAFDLDPGEYTVALSYDGDDTMPIEFSVGNPYVSWKTKKPDSFNFNPYSDNGFVEVVSRKHLELFWRTSAYARNTQPFILCDEDILSIAGGSVVLFDPARGVTKWIQDFQRCDMSYAGHGGGDILFIHRPHRKRASLYSLNRENGELLRKARLTYAKNTIPPSFVADEELESIYSDRTGYRGMLGGPRILSVGLNRNLPSDRNIEWILKLDESGDHWIGLDAMKSRFFCFDVRENREVWSLNMDRVNVDVVLDGDQLFLGPNNCVNPISGEVIWQNNTYGRISPFSIGENALYVNRGRGFVAVDRSSGETVWGISAGDRKIAGMGIVVLNDIIYYSDSGSVVVGLKDIVSYGVVR